MSAPPWESRGESYDAPAPGDPARVNVFAVVVLYGLKPAESVSYRTLMAQIPEFSAQGNRIQVLVYDNTGGETAPGPLPGSVLYEVSPRNAGLAPAYNRGLSLAQSLGFDWLLTLDDDTTLPPRFLMRMAEEAGRREHDRSVAAVVPQLCCGEKPISPVCVRLIHNTALPRGFTGFSNREMFALNSAALLRVTAIAAIGGFPEQFWMNYLDICLHHLLFRAGLRIYVAGDLAVEHKLSLDDYASLSPERYRWFLEAESAFFDLHRGRIRNAILTLTLLYRYVRHWGRGDSADLRAEAVRILKARLFHSRKWRITRWNAEVEKRYRG